MKKLIVLLLMFFGLFLISCTDDQLKDEYTIDLNTTLTLPKEFVYEYSGEGLVVNSNKIKAVALGEHIITTNSKEIKINVVLNLEKLFPKNVFEVTTGEKFNLESNILGVDITYTSASPLLVIEDNVVTMIDAGEGYIEASASSQSCVLVFKITAKESFEVENSLEMYLDTIVELDINIIYGDINDLKVTSKSSNILVVDKTKIHAVSDGVGYVVVKLGDVEKTIEVNVIMRRIEVLNESLTVDILDKLDLILKYPDQENTNVTYTIQDPSILSIKNNVVFPNKTGKTRVSIYLENDASLRKDITIEVSVDPIKIIEYVHIENVLMKKNLSTYGASTQIENLYGGVSKYFFGDLNLRESIVKLWDNPYVGQYATEEIFNAIDPLKQTDTSKRMPRTGVLLSKLNYLTFHDTGNNNVGAKAQGNVNYMMSESSITYMARSWHFTVDDKEVIQTLPENEVGWHGDNFYSYTQSIGIETCVDFGARHNVTWQRTGKLCGMLLSKYNLDMSAIKQHYDWNGKNCPQTLRRNNLYPYALSLIEAEWLIHRALSDYKIEFTSLTPEYLDDEGQIIKNPTEKITVSYKVTITSSKGYNETITLSSFVSPLS